MQSSGPLPECLVRRVAGEVVSALRSFHASGVIYADCKPANFCLVSTDAFGSIGAVDANGCGDISAVGRGLSTIRIVDFGCSQQLVPGGELHVTKRTGTLAYMAPEVGWPWRWPFGASRVGPGAANTHSAPPTIRLDVAHSGEFIFLRMYFSTYEAFACGRGAWSLMGTR